MGGGGRNNATSSADAKRRGERRGEDQRRCRWSRVAVDEATGWDAAFDGLIDDEDDDATSESSAIVACMREALIALWPRLIDESVLDRRLGSAKRSDEGKMTIRPPSLTAYPPVW